MEKYKQKKVQFQSDTYNEQVTLYGDIFEPNDKIKGIIQIIHGMGEHRIRYYDFCSFLAKNGYVVVIYDQRGHRETCGTIENQGYMSDVDNFNALVIDANLVTNEVKKLYPNKKYILMGHSMGSFVSQRYIQIYPNDADALILLGTNYTKAFLFKIGAIIAKLIVKKQGRKAISKTLINMSFGSFNKAFKPNRTKYDWLSVNEENIDKYIVDPYCGADFSASYFMDLTVGFSTIAKNHDKINKDLPIYLFSGDKDPVGNNGKGVTKLYNKYNKIGIKDVQIKLYANGRHEMLNETNKKEVYNNVLSWINKI